MLFIRVLDICTKVSNIIGSLLIVAIMLLIGADVIGRGIFSSPIAGVPELVSLAIVAIVFLQLPSTVHTNRLTRSDAIITRLNTHTPKLGKLLETAIDSIAIVILAIIFRASVPLFIKAWKTQQFIGAIGNFTAPTWPVKLIILMGIAMLILQFAIRILRRYVKGLL